MADAVDEARETARWIVSVTLQRGHLVQDDEDVADQLFYAESHRLFYVTHLRTTVSRLISEMTNFDASEEDLVGSMHDVRTARDFINQVVTILKPKLHQSEDRCAASLPLQECEPYDS